MFFKYLLMSVVIATLSTPAQAESKFKSGEFDHYVLAVSWLPAFCELHQRKPECKKQTEKDYSAHNFSLHGLWPSREIRQGYSYCDMDEETFKQYKNMPWCQMPKLDLSNETRDELKQTMPASIQSCLQRHEWYKHGTCTTMSVDEYYQRSNDLLDMLNKSKFARLVEQNIGKYIQRNDLLNAFANEFGKTNRNYLSLHCKKVDNVSLLSEVRLYLANPLQENQDLTTYFPTEKIKIRGGCPQRFKIDGVGK
jgi:ribonuclease T2